MVATGLKTCDKHSPIGYNFYHNRYNQMRCLTINSFCYNKTLTIDNNKVRREINKRNAEVIDIWDQMSEQQLAEALKRPISDIKKAVKELKITDYPIEDVKDFVRIIKFFDKKPNFVKNPSLVTKDEFDFDEHLNKLLKNGTNLVTRVPVVTIMGHVDHGKTTLLDSLRHSEIVKQEFGGITQHIGAFVVSLDQQNNQKKISKNLVTFLDTPGHKAFSAMRERGANITDIVVLVVATDDGVMEQTIESIIFAKSSNVPIIVAINKVDKSVNLTKDINYLKTGLRAQGIVLEDDGGDIQAIKISALKNIGIEDMKEAILALAETMELKAYFDGSVEAVVLESSVDAKKGKTASILVQNGTLKKGDIIIAGQKSWAKVRAMYDEWGNVIEKCNPGFPVQVIGWREEDLPDAGDKVWQLPTEKDVKELVNLIKARDRRRRAEADAMAAQNKLEEHLKVYREELIALRSAGIRYKRKKNKGPREKMITNEGEENKLNVIFKCDVTGSLEVLYDMFDSYPNDKSDAKVNLLHFGVGAITENEVELGACFDRTVIYSFNVNTMNPAVNKLAKELNVTIKKFNVIYHLVDDLKKEISDRLPLIDEEVVLGEALVQQEFVVNDKHRKIPVAGVRCAKGVLKKSNCLYKVIRNEQQVTKDLKVSSLRHLKDEMETIKKDVECGIRFDGIVGLDGLRFQPQDTLVCYEMHKIKQKTNWTPKGF
ncbi:translation initiation factor IF-2, mitochondrial-like [Oppia nitens]|uniref:translation initiation factor IF-2, mitochondrial-like n=1 Tax=Oppia nitens TaxID=1686743 RepID=UPI0023DBFAB8|nr:translation initiation factor IF-2, mitochondrial-like [Oppia nitens]